MILKRYKVENFRSVLDSGWIECENVTTLVGINEAGKSNLLLALWKLNPAREGKIDILHDIPVSKLSAFRKTPDQVRFITVEFELDDESIAQIESTVDCDIQGDKSVIVTRFYDGHYTFEFPSGKPKSTKVETTTIAGEEAEEPIEEETIVPYDESFLEKAIISEMPTFVYYSNYGNLSSQCDSMAQWKHN
ncbi:AAA family ATPase [Mucilaginibacter sp. Bleaf8]|uniref:AAA family ATPase n=1 Tax=Mucilaginibacter sp. Bleaf8 TaxID=2834430 RepID=UPI001BCB0AEA|nr:AAA family ATPase [Mucilaginibacter sp. Bleaf8]MBS7565771.1 AAA family ATPase [Mucilaginibacter sp. Bleaf8]